MDIDLIKVAGGLIIGVVIILVFKFMIELPFKIVWNSLVGAAILYLVNLTGLVAIKITFVHALIVGVLGVPGLIGLLIYLHYFK